MLFKDALAPLVDLIYPPRCPSCGTCQRPFEVDSIQDGATCAACLVDPPDHDGIAAGTLYNDASRRLILTFKHGRRIALAAMLARLINARLPELSGEWLVVPVPLHRMRLWHRGFNQSALLAREISRDASRRLLVDALVRRKATPVLGRLGRTERKKALSGAITSGPA